MKQIRDAISGAKSYVDSHLGITGEADDIQVLISFVEQALAAMMPEKREILEKEETKYFTANDMNVACNTAIDACTRAITGALLSEEEIEKILLNPEGLWVGTPPRNDDYNEAYRLAKQIHSAQMEKLKGGEI